MYRVAICEDEAPVRESLHRMCGELLAELDVPNEITTFSRAEALKTDLRPSANTAAPSRRSPM